ncbi:DUF427 domain-containing protein [Tautonia plasticadhaerens]|uniref:DUF427 domain-containing protein n=1 Tax=Tautonia plasticadhaerens TaxID=2527974 RepID=A0A518HDG4_9BACT|nr:DUF427 domain-containing protein [Tautonia plasticadhaerens]QDV38899.1 hypothetical protein ElP_68590 [Tautonia plasticadhaerens]
MSNPHQITIEPVAGRVLVTYADKTIADSTRALALKEGAMATAYYLPREDVVMAAMDRGERSTHCPFKGDASYFRLSVGDRVIDDVAWSYEDPRAEVAAIKDHLSFDRDKVGAIVVQ